MIDEKLLEDDQISEYTSQSELDQESITDDTQPAKEPERTSFMGKLWGYMFGSSGRQAVSPAPKEKKIPKQKKKVIKKREKKQVLKQSEHYIIKKPLDEPLILDKCSQ